MIKHALAFVNGADESCIKCTALANGDIMIRDINVDELQKMEQNSKEKGNEIIKKIIGESRKSMVGKAIKNAQKGDFTQR
jgi:hypothetical protein